MTASAALPTLFVSHGAPTLALEDSPTGRFLDGLGGRLPRPAAIVVASAHFAAAQAVVGAHPQPPTVHDFHGFPAPLYALRYAAPGAPALAARVVGLLHAADFDARADAQAGLDHGVWVPLWRMYPQADIPVLPLAVNPGADADWHFRLGAALAPLRYEGVLLVGSGGFVHNLGALAWQGGPAPPWASAFAAWLESRLSAGDDAAARDWLRVAPQPRLAHPTPEHLWPLFVAWGAAGGAARPLHRAWEYGSLALHAYAFDG
ncbi:extradiol aromatic ring-opening dioxygenase, DODA type [Mizugakiibacter sediminis]|uniref:Extradiol aromatic ring-opening dioxygenase, DODA type n=1 Tax=Mizugakiibacter sediminis TaxID=1475481 RepID=A0A0K8QL29_9GAMM|nr:class III extradiol ring-cleavage dioxygenase [Mizugakiibacter sediminis]GAP65406.1 extradiol aromatic ring-opening dioxygenase, DODA type [Mizugakiibacter sediminis]